MGSARTSARGAAEATQDATVEAGASPARGRDDETIAVEAEPRWGRWIVADDADAGPGQIRHGVLFATLRRDLYRACDAELLRVGRTAMDCPYIATWLAYYEAMAPDHVERAVAQYAGVEAGSGDELIALVVARAQRAVATWARTGVVGDEPGQIGDDGAVGVDDASEGEVIAAPYTIAQAIGVDPQAVRIRRDAAVTRRADALAVTVGSEIALAPEAPGPGSIEGDLLLAHELAHVAHQAGGGTASPGAAHEADADRSAVAAVAASRGGASVATGRAKPSLTSGVALQRCGGGGGSSEKKESTAEVEQAARDAGIPDGDAGATADDAATADPGYHLSTRTVESPGTVTATSELKSLGEIARSYYGARGKWPMLQKSNPDVKDTAMRTDGKKATKVSVPAAVLYEPAPEFTIDPRDDGAMGHETWRVERHQDGDEQSLSPTVPDDASGVTLGRGYDMKARSGATIKAELMQAGIAEATAETYMSAAELKGPDAKVWIAKHPVPPITTDQEVLLFQQEYRRTADQVVDFVGKVEWDKKKDEWVDFPNRGYELVGGTWKPKVDLSTVSPKVLELIIDLRFRGDLGPKSWLYLLPAVEANDAAQLGTLIADKAGYRANIDKNHNRYAARCRILGVDPVSLEDWKR